MALNLKNAELDRLARELARRRGEKITEAVLHAVRQELERDRRRRHSRGLAERLMEIGRHCASLPVYDERTADEILGYDEHGLPS